MKSVDITIIGGGLAGLSSAIQLARKDLDILLVEKKEYPFHRVCGEYVSNEARPFLERTGIFPGHMNPPDINRLLLTSTSGRQSTIQLPLGGFGISRYSFDHFLYRTATEAGVRFLTRKYVQSINFRDDRFELKLNDQQKINCSLVIGAFGKRSLLDKTLDRPFMKRRSPYLAVKYHLKGDFPPNLIALHNFKGGYAGVCIVENELINLCYLASRNELKKLGDLRRLEEKVLMENPFLKRIFNECEFLPGYPKVINEISFESKRPVERHILMCGDAAGMIAPLCGNGMAMAIRSSCLLTPLVLKYFKSPNYHRAQLEQEYATTWNSHFNRHIRVGRSIQLLFGSRWASSLAVSLAGNFPEIAGYLVRQTHGRVF